jgi:guanylate kinase
MYKTLKQAQAAIAALRQSPIKPIIIMGLYGTNRRIIINEFVDLRPNLKKIVGYCTREKELHEAHELDHYFCKKEQFKAVDLIAGTVHAVYAGYQSGISLSDIEKLIESQKQGLFVVSSVKSMVTLYKLFQGEASVIFITAPYEYRYKNIYEKYIETKNGNSKIQNILSFADQQEHEFEDPFVEKIVDYTLQVKPGMSPSEGALKIDSYLQSFADPTPAVA